ncbi:MAG: hypothetical protein ACRCUY_05715 [Thermoguttaceae bacterium]
MTLMRKKKGVARVIATSILSGLTLFGSLSAQDAPDFEAMLREAIQGPPKKSATVSQEKSETPSKTPASDSKNDKQGNLSKIDKPAPSTSDIARQLAASQREKEIPSKMLAANSTVNSAQKRIETTGDGWSSLDSVETSATPKNNQQIANLPEQSELNGDANDEPVYVAQNRRANYRTPQNGADSPKTVKTSEVNNWDAIPETVDPEVARRPNTVDSDTQKEERKRNSEIAQNQNDATNAASETPFEVVFDMQSTAEKNKPNNPSSIPDKTESIASSEVIKNAESARNDIPANSPTSKSDFGKLTELTEGASKHVHETSGIAATKEVAKDATKEVVKDGTKEAAKTDAANSTPAQKPTTPQSVAVKKIVEPVYPDFDDDENPSAVPKKLINSKLAGDPNSKEKIQLMYDEIVNGLKTRSWTGKYDMWRSYARSTLRNTASLNTGSEVDGRCRLSWYQQLYNDVLPSVFDAEEFSRFMHVGLGRNHRYIAEAMTMIRQKLDVPARNDGGVRFLQCKTSIDALNEVKRCLIEAKMHHARALSTLTSAEINELNQGLVQTFVGSGCVNGHTIPSRSVGRRLVNIVEKMDKTGFHDAAESLIPLTNQSLLALLEQLPTEGLPTVMMNGQTVQRLVTSAGDIIIAGRENNVFDLDSPEFRDVICLINRGGNNSYREGTCGLHRPVFALIDLHGNDTYTGVKPGIQGGSVLGVSILVDCEGSDSYSAGDVAQGSTLVGAGMLFDFGGNDNYKGLRRVQGHALEGIGLLVSRSGDDKFRAAMWAQGFGAPGGFGVVENSAGNNYYYCGGLYIDSYPEHPGYDGWGQGIGAGIRQVANGGIGLFMNGEGNDVYEVDYFGHGGGYWLGVGIARDFGGNDIRHGTTKSAYDGGPRREKEWTRFANGFGCHYALGFCIDDAGSDVYGGTIMGTGMAWDLSIGYLCDFGGNDKFLATGGMTQGVGAEGSIGVLYCYGGDDVFNGRNQALCSGSITYHSPSQCGSNFSFLINYGGNDTYGCGVQNNSYAQRGTPGGFLVDRPTDKEAAIQAIARKKLIQDREKEIADFDAAIAKAKEEAAAKGQRYMPPRNLRRPTPVSAVEQSQIGSVPSFDSMTGKSGSAAQATNKEENDALKTGVNTVNVGQERK